MARQTPRTVKEVLAEVGDDSGAAAAFLLVERQSNRPRRTLVAKLERIVLSDVRPGANSTALEQALVALAVGPEHAALVAACRSLAKQVDHADTFDDKAWREYRLSLRELMEATAGGGSDAFDEWLQESRAEVGDI